jgi:uroporphyrinogen-III synthase
VLSPGAAKRFGDLESFFAAKGAGFDAPALYETKAVNYELNKVDSFLFDNRVEAVSFFSPSAVNAFMRQAGLNGAAAVCIGDTTAGCMRSYGVLPLVSPKRTTEALAEYIKDL